MQAESSGFSYVKFSSHHQNVLIEEQTKHQVSINQPEPEQREHKWMVAFLFLFFSINHHFSKLIIVPPRHVIKKDMQCSA